MKKERVRTATKAWTVGLWVLLFLLLFGLVPGAHAQRGSFTSAPPGMVAWWRAEGNAVDSANGNNGAVQPGAGFAAGMVGRAFAFTGAANSYVEVPDSPSLHTTVAVTIEFWVKRTSLDFSTHPADYVLEKGGDWTGNQVNYGVALHNPGYNYCLHFTFAGGWRGGGSVPDTNWHHCAVVARNGDANPTFYIDGAAQPVTYASGAGTITLYDSNRPLHIGAMLDPVTGWMYYGRELVDELSIYNRALSASEIQAIYQAGSAGKYPVNNWVNPFSAKWESPSWSLGKLPASDQTVQIMNDGYKAVNLDSTTVAGFPGSLTVGSLAVGAPTNALSTLLLNYFGLNTPLKVLNSCLIEPNGALLNLGSSFEVDGGNDGALTVDGGTFTQQEGLTIVNGPAFVRNGNFTATNGNLTLGQLTVGSGTGSPDPYNPDAVFTQDGGSIAAQSVNIEQGGTYHLVSGVLYGINGTTCTGCPFFQYGGTNYGDITTVNYYYWLKGGMVQGNVLTAANDSGFVQDAGLLDMKFINVTGNTNWPILGATWLSGGTVRCGTLNIGGNGKIQLRGADVFLTNQFDLHGMEFNVAGHGPVIEYADCEQWGGHFYLPSMSLGQYGYYNLMGGLQQIRGSLSMSGGDYTLAGGTLETTGTGVGAAASFAHGGGGQHLVHGVLSITGTYTLTGGSLSGGCTLICEGLYLRGAMKMTLAFDGREFDPAATFTNTGVLNLGGTLSTELPDIHPGQVQLATNALLDLSVRFPAVVHFQNSSALEWTPGALLIITNWSSSDHVFAGNDASGLTASQLQQVQFVNPASFASGMYSAQILSNGEIVPAQQSQPPMLTTARMPNALVLSWPGNYQLLSATNVTGPYEPVSGASSPWTNFFSRPSQFFMLAPP